MAQDWIDVREAWDCIERHVAVLGSESCSLEHLLGRVLAEPIGADRGTEHPFDARRLEQGVDHAARVAFVGFGIGRLVAGCPSL